MQCWCLETFPRMLSGCSRLEVLIVEECDRLRTLPEDLGDISSLKKVHLEGLGELRQLPSLVNARGLKKLFVVRCPKVVLDPALLNLPSLDVAYRQSLRKAMRRAR